MATGERTGERIKTNITIDKALWRELQKIALDRDTSGSELAEQAIRDWLKKYRQSVRPALLEVIRP